MNAPQAPHVALRQARVAGLLYLAIIVCGVWSDGFVRSSLIVADEPTKTAANIAATTSTFQMSLVADSVMVLCDVALAVVLFLLLEPVSRALALTAAAFRIVQSAVLGLNLLNQHLALVLITAGGYELAPPARDSLVLLFAQAQGHGYDIGLLFFGINCVLTGYLVFKSRFLPRAVGVLVAASGPVYLVGSYLSLLAPHTASTFEIAYVLPLVAELSFCLWLLFKGIDTRAWPGRVAPSS